MAFNVDWSYLTDTPKSTGNMIQSALPGLVNIIRAKKEQNRIGGLASKALEGNTDAQAELAYESPEINASVMKQLGAKSEQQQKAMIYDLSEVANLHDAGKDDEAINYLNDRISAIESRRGDASHTKFIKQLFESNPDIGAQFTKRTLLSMINPEEFAKVVNNQAKQAAPSGYRWTDNGNLEAIPGGPAIKDKAAPSGYQWNEDGTLSAIPGGPAAKGTELPTNAFNAFAAGMKEKNPNVTAEEISNAWQESETKKIQERYPTKTAVSTIPGLIYDRRSGEFSVGKLPEGLDVGTLSSVKADTSALNNITNREQLIDSFVRRIDANVPVVESLAAKVNNFDNKLLNVPINDLKGKIGSGELQSLKLTLRSLSNEVAKVESGSLGIAEVSQGQAEAMNKIHDPNLSLSDLKTVLDTTKLLGETNKKAIAGQRTDLINRIHGTMSGNPENQPANLPTTNDQGWTLMTDANGNKAYVSPDGKNFQEVQ